jgi:hypothetical protein
MVISISSKINSERRDFPLSRQVLGKTLVILGASAMIINLSFFKQMEWYDIVRWISYALFGIGFLLIPTYFKSKSND